MCMLQTQVAILTHLVGLYHFFFAKFGIRMFFFFLNVDLCCYFYQSCKQKGPILGKQVSYGQNWDNWYMNRCIFFENWCMRGCHLILCGGTFLDSLPRSNLSAPSSNVPSDVQWQSLSATHPQYLSDTPVGHFNSGHVHLEKADTFIGRLI